MYHYTLQKNNDTDSYSLNRDENNKEHMHQNSLLDLMMVLLKDVDNSLNSLYKSIDNDTLLITDLVDGLSRPQSHQADPYNFGALHELVTRRNDYVTGKVGIGPFALNVTNNILTYLYGVQFNPELKICKETQIGRLDRLVDMDGNSISAWLSAFINAHVDIVKDPYISLFNVNSYTYNMVNLLIRSGYGYRAMKFLTQPVIVEMAKASNNFNSKYAKDKKNIKDRETTIMDAASMVIYGETGRVNKLTIDKENRKESYGVWCINKVMKDIEDEKTINQNEVLHAFILLQPFAQSLSNLVKYTKIDTRKLGKNFMETLNYYDGYQRLFHNETGSGERIIKPGGSIWDLKSLKDLSEMSWIEDKTINGIMEPIKVLANLTFNANSEFRSNVLNYANILNYNTEDEGNPEALKLLSQQAATLIKLRFFNNYANKVLGRNIQSLFVGSKSVAAKLDRLKFLILTDPEYKHLLGNAFLERLTSAPQQDVMKVGHGSAVVPRFINVVKSLDGGAIEENPIIDGWYDLLNDPKTMKISRELVVYAFLTSGERKGFSNLFKFVPPEFLRGELENSTIDGTSFVKHVERMLTEPGAIDARLNLDEIVQNNYDEYNFVKKMSLTRRLDNETILNFNFVGNPSDIQSPLVLISNNSSVTEAEYPYLAINKKNKTSNRSENTNLYKMISPGIYILMPKKGYSGKGKTRIYEYGASYGFAFNEILGYEYNKFQKAFEYLLLFISYLNPDRNNSILSHAEYMADPRVSSFIAKHMMDYVNGNIKIDINDVVNWMTDTVENRPTLDLKQQSLTRTGEEPRVVQPKNKEARPTQQGTDTDGVRKELVIANSAKRSDLLAKAKEVHGVITTRPNGADWFKTPGMHFGNPFSFADYAGVKVLVKDAHEAVVAYEQWLRGEKYQDIEPQRRLWILDKINKGHLDNRPLVYYTNGVKDTDGQRKIYDYDTFPNHAHILLKLINEHKLNALISQQQPTTTTETNQLQAPAIPTAPQQKQLKTSVAYTPKGKTKQTYEVKEDNTGIHIFNKDGKEVFANKGVDRNRIIANYKFQNGDGVIVEQGGHEYIVLRVGNKFAFLNRITGTHKTFKDNNEARQEVLDKAKQKFSEKDAANNMQSTISELDKLGEQRKKDCE